MRAVLVLIGFSAGLGCSCFSPVGEPDSGTTTGSGATSGGSTGSPSGGATSGGGCAATEPTTGGAEGGSCGFNRIWQGDHCVAIGCAAAQEGTPCALADDGGRGACYGERCQTIDFNTDSNNCERYGEICPSGTSCKAARCGNANGQTIECAADSCPPGWTCTSDEWGFLICILSQCDVAQVGQSCLLSDPYPRFGRCCGTSCLGLDTNDHCGGCGAACLAGQFCDLSTYPPACRPDIDCSQARGEVGCQLPDGSAGQCCHGTCADIQHDVNNCGGCGLACPVGSECLFTAYGDLNPSYCSPFPLVDGGRTPCGGRCPADQTCWVVNGDYRCLVTSCTSTTENYPCGVTADQRSRLFNIQPAPSVCCSSTCSRLQGDNLNCGACGVQCPQGTFCNEGACTPETGCELQGNDQPCGLDTGESGICCDGVCVDFTSDPKHCSSCEQACPSGTFCGPSPPGYHPACLTADGGPADCTSLGCEPGWGCVVNPDSSIPGVCLSFSCTVSSALTTRCAGDSLGGGAYASGTCCATVCDDQAAFTACAANADLVTRCGKGFKPCPGGGVCVQSFCYRPGCLGHQDGESCGGSLDGGAGPPQGVCCSGDCVDLTSDPANCGGCGISCDVCTGSGCFPTGPTGSCNASCPPDTICAGGFCLDSSCSTGYGHAFGCLARDGNLGLCCPDGACADLRNDPLNCGSCGVQCAAGQSCACGTCQ